MDVGLIPSLAHTKRILRDHLDAKFEQLGWIFCCLAHLPAVYQLSSITNNWADVCYKSSEKDGSVSKSKYQLNRFVIHTFSYNTESV